MLEQIDRKLEDQGKTIKEISDRLREEIELRKQDQLKIEQLESSVKEWKTRLEEKLCAAFEGIHDKLDQIQEGLLSERGALPVYDQLMTQHQVRQPFPNDPNYNFNTSAFNTSDAPGFNVVHDMYRPPNVYMPPNPAAGDQHPDTNVKINLATAPPTSCYSNWVDDIHGKKLLELKLVSYRDLDDTLDKICAKKRKSTPEDMTHARTSIFSLKLLKVDKYNRFPSTGNYVDIKLDSKRNKKLRKMFGPTDRETFYEAAKEFKYFISKTSLDQWLFEDTFELQWTP